MLGSNKFGAIILVVHEVGTAQRLNDPLHHARAIVTIATKTEQGAHRSVIPMSWLYHNGFPALDTCTMNKLTPQHAPFHVMLKFC